MDQATFSPNVPAGWGGCSRLLLCFVLCSCCIVLRRVLPKFQCRLGVIPVEAKTRQMSIAVSRTQAEAESVRSRSSSRMRLDSANIVCLWSSGHGKLGEAATPSRQLKFVQPRAGLAAGWNGLRYRGPPMTLYTHGCKSVTTGAGTTYNRVTTN